MAGARKVVRGHSRQARIACSRRSDSRAREKNSRRKNNERRLEGERGRELALAPLPPPGFLGVQPNSLPNYPRALVSERLEQARRGKQSFVHFQVHVFSSFADNTIHPSIYQSKWSGLSSRTRCPLQFAVT